MRIRPVTVDDVDLTLHYISKLQEENLETLYRWNPLPTPAEQQQLLERYCGDQGTAYALVDADDDFVGMLSGTRHPRTPLAHSCSFAVSVLAAYRGLGYGTKLIHEFDVWACRYRLMRIELDVFGNNPKALKLYKRLGYAVEGVRREAINIGSHYHDLIHMAKFLDR